MLIVKHIIAAAALAAFGAGTAVLAAGEAQQKEQKGMSIPPSPEAKKQPFEKLDTDNDGYIGHIEAMADEDAGSKFHELDQNNDQRLSRAEYQAWEPGKAAVGGTGTTSEEETSQKRSN